MTPALMAHRVVREKGGRSNNDRAVTCDHVTPALCLALQDINEKKEEGAPICLGLSPQML